MTRSQINLLGQWPDFTPHFHPCDPCSGLTPGTVIHGPVPAAVIHSHHGPLRVRCGCRLPELAWQTYHGVETEDRDPEWGRDPIDELDCGR